jgi:hypothetical protein
MPNTGYDNLLPTLHNVLPRTKSTLNPSKDVPFPTSSSFTSVGMPHLSRPRLRIFSSVPSVVAFDARPKTSAPITVTVAATSPAMDRPIARCLRRRRFVSVSTSWSCAHACSSEPRPVHICNIEREGSVCTGFIGRIGPSPAPTAVHEHNSGTFVTVMVIHHLRVKDRFAKSLYREYR